MIATSEQDLAEAIAAAKEPLQIVGGGTRGFETSGVPLTVSGLRGIELYEPGALTVVVRAGTPLEELETALAAENQGLAFEPMDHRALLGTTGTPTAGALVAANISGPRRIAVGAARDFALGVRFVDGTGTILKNGGRVMKNVTGYDLVKLISGSFGTLGVLSEVSLKVLPRPETQATIILHGQSLPDAVAAMAAGLGSPFEITGAAHERLADARTLLRLEGFEASVAYRVEQVKTLLSRFGDVTVESDPSHSASLWSRIRDVKQLAGCSAVWRVSVKPSDAPDYLDILDQQFGYSTLMDWAGGLLWIGFDDAQLDQAASYGEDGNGVRVVHDVLQHNCTTMGGHATLIKAPAQTRTGLPVFQPQPAALAAISAGIRARFDPRGILNSGLMG